MARTWEEGEKHPEPVKDKIRAELLCQKLDKFVAGEITLTPAQVNAAKILIDKGKATLQAIQETPADPWEGKSEQELFEQVQALITSHPELAKQLNIGIRAVEPAPKEDIAA